MSLEIITPGRFIEPSDPVSLLLKYEGWYTLSALKNGIVTRTHSFKDSTKRSPFPNLILNQGLDRLTEGGAYRYFKVGLGTTPPAVTDVELTNPLAGNMAGTRISVSGGAPPDYYYSETIQGISTTGQFGNNNLTEIRVGGSSDNQAFSKALIVDSLGNPTAFPILSDEQLLATYELRVYPPLSDAFYTVNVAGSRDCVVRALGVTQSTVWTMPAPTGGAAMVGVGTNSSMYTGDLNPYTSTVPQGSGLNNNSSTVTNGAYSIGTYARSVRYSFSTLQAVGTGMTHAARFACCAFQISYDPPLVKTNEQTMYLDYMLSWDRR